MPSPALPHEQDYSVFGLRVRSSIPLPELFAAEGEGEPDVTIAVGPVAEPENAEAGLIAVQDGLMLVIPDVGRYLVQSGSRITVDPQPGAPDRNVRLFLLGSAFGALIHQRGLLPLHANAVEMHGTAYAFMGPSGAGKSTLAAWFHDQGCRVLADDVCVIRFDDQGHAIACPGLPRFRLWLDTIRLTGREVDGLHRSYVGQSAEVDKFDVPVEPSAMIRNDVRIGGIYLLDEGDSFSIEELQGIEAADAIFANTYRGAYLAAAGAHRNHWQSAIMLARTTPVFRVRRTRELAQFQADCEMIVAHGARLSATAGN